MHIMQENEDVSMYLVPEQIYRFNIAMFFDPEDELEVSTFLPLNNDRQEIIEETVIAKDLQMEDKSSLNGRYVSWYGNEESKQISYSSLLSLQALKYQISPELMLPKVISKENQRYLTETEHIPVHHQEIIALWNTLKPANEHSLYQVLDAIYNYTYHSISPLPFKGLTDSLTTLRLGAASCNGKSRLFISLARLNGLPARLVGGVILNGDKKKTSHQWVEVNIENNWVPFDVTNGHFSSLPKHYLELYRGDNNLFRHTSNINFDYYFNSSKQHTSQALYRDVQTSVQFIPNVAVLLQDLGLPLKATYIFLLFPLCTLLIAFQRNILGIQTFGIFMPILIAAACIYTGFIQGLIGFSSVLFLAVLGHSLLGKFHVLKIPRLAAIITLIAIVSLIGISLIDRPIGVETGILILFPAVIISFTADRIHQLSDEHNWLELVQNGLGTFTSITICYITFNSILLQGLFSLYPELLLCVLAILLHIGNWSGMRISEIIRFRKLLTLQEHNVLGLNARNKNIIYQHNDKKLLTLAADKLLTKQALIKEGIPCPSTSAICRSYPDIKHFMTAMTDKVNFVIKPNNGSRGNGILILRKPVKGGFINSSGKFWSYDDIKNHVSEILAGSFSQSGKEDEAYIEPMIDQEPTIKTISPRGLCDIRLIICNGKLISAMLRIPTHSSNGKANLHQGAIGASIDLQTGRIGSSFLKGKKITHHPDTDVSLQEVHIPFWNDIIDISLQCYIAIPLGYMGVDICIDRHIGPLVLEVNGRPGLEIQNIQSHGISKLVKEAF